MPTNEQPDNADLGSGYGSPTEFAPIKPGDVIVDLGSGAGDDCFLARAKTGDTGRVIGLDRTPTRINLARQNAEARGYTNVEFVCGDIEAMPLPAAFADVVVSNGVMHLVPDKLRAFDEIYRVLKPGGQVCLSDIVLSGEQPNGYESGTIQEQTYLDTMAMAGFENIQIQKREAINPIDGQIDTYRQSDAGGVSLIIYAQKPADNVPVLTNETAISTDQMGYELAGMTYRPATETDRPTLISLLQQASLTTDDLPVDISPFLLAFSNQSAGAEGELIGAAGIELLGEVGLLRSVAVAPDYQGHYIGQTLVDGLMQAAEHNGLTDLYLLTTTADGFFERLGFERIPRDDVPDEVRQTPQFSTGCPDSAVVMRYIL